MTSPEKVAANRRNALKSTGPKSADGKARSSRNATTHGLTAQPGEPTAAYLQSRDEWMADLKPRGILERTLTERVCRAAWNLMQCDRHEDASAFQRNRDAAAQAELAEARRVDAIGHRLIDVPEAIRNEVVKPNQEPGPAPIEAEDPALLVAELRSSAAGVRWLMARWGELDRALKDPEGWYGSHRFIAGRLLGLRAEAVEEHPLLSGVARGPTAMPDSWNGLSWFDHPAMEGAVDAAEEAEANGLGNARTLWFNHLHAVMASESLKTEPAAAGPNQLKAMVRSERQKLNRLLKKVLQPRAQEDQAGAADRAMFDESRSRSLCLRYASASSRDLHRAIRELARLRKERGDDDDSSQVVPNQPDGPNPEVPAPRTNPGLATTGGDTANLRNEANSDTTATGRSQPRSQNTASQKKGRKTKPPQQKPRPEKGTENNRQGDGNRQNSGNELRPLSVWTTLQPRNDLRPLSSGGAHTHRLGV